MFVCHTKWIKHKISGWRLKGPTLPSPVRYLLLRVVDLLAQPELPTTQTGAPAPLGSSAPAVEPYDISLDPWNALGPCPASGPGIGSGTASGVPVGPDGPPLHSLNPSACAFYPMVSCSTAPSVPCHGCHGTPSLPQFGTSAPGYELLLIHPHLRQCDTLSFPIWRQRTDRTCSRLTCLWLYMWLVWVSLCLATPWPYYSSVCPS